jgi:dipeptidyl aminopeptidase/acylaminoacyl peptidase
MQRTRAARACRSLALAAALLACPIGTATAQRAVTVADSIEMTVIVDPNAYVPRFTDESFKVAPDGRRFFTVTRRGNIAGNYNEYTLLVFDSERVREYVNGRGPRPEGRAVAQFRSTSNRPGIAAARWFDDSRTVAFLGENPHEQAQVHVVDVANGKLRRLTSHPTSVREFDVNHTTDAIVYAALVSGEWTAEERNGVVLRDEFAWQLVQRNRGEWFYEKIALFAGQQGSPARPVAMKPYDIRSDPWAIALAPDGRKAVAVIHVEQSPDRWWSDYRPVAVNPYFKAAGARSEYSSFTSEHREVFLQFVLIDVASGAMQPLVDAPTGLYFGGARIDAHWTDENHVLLVNTFLPLQDVAGAELERRRASPAIVEVDVRSGELRRVIDLDTDGAGRGAASGTLARSELLPNGDLQLTRRSREGVFAHSILRRQGGAWRELAAQDAVTRPRAAPLALNIAQDINTPPEIRATDPATGRSAVVTDLNPQLRAIDLGQAEIFNWKTADGRTVTGGLVKPLHQPPGARAPLVLQTHGFDAQTFLMDGPGNSPSGFAARGLAAAGIAVLQVPDVSPKTVRAGLLAQIDVLRRAVDALREGGAIDPDKVGMHGWSNTGYLVQHAITFSDLKLAAASVADADNLGTVGYSLYFKAGYPGMVNHERLIGAPLWGDEGRRIWAEHDPIRYLDAVRTPLKIETYGRTLFGWWDTYALLRRHNRPAEYLYFPDGDHVLAKPRERLLSQQSAVDWYRFWLKGEEDPDPAKAARYRSWRQLRAQAAQAE